MWWMSVLTCPASSLGSGPGPGDELGRLEKSQPSTGNGARLLTNAAERSRPLNILPLEQ